MPDGQTSLTDPDVRAKAIKVRANGLVGCNSRTAVGTETYRVVAHEIPGMGYDRDLLWPTAKAAKTALKRQDLHVLAGKATFSGQESPAWRKVGITTLSRSSAAFAQGRRGEAPWAHRRGGVA